MPDRRAALPNAIFFAALASVSVGLTAAFLLLDMQRLVAVVADGAGYYLQIARNVAAGRGLTFDGMHPTNGFHPLWMGVLIVLFKASSGSAETLYRVVGVLNVALVTAAALGFHRTLRGLVSAEAAAVGGVVFLAMAALGASLMESALLLVALTALLWAGQRQFRGAETSVAEAVVFGLLLGLTILTRLSEGFLALVFGLVALWRIASGREPQPRRALGLLVCTVLGASVLVVPDLVYNLRVFGALVPVSGRLESVYPASNLDRLFSVLRELGGPRLLAAAAALAFLGWFLRPRSNDARGYLPSAIAMASAAYLVNLTHELLLVKWQLYWHHVALVPISGALAALAWDRHVAGGRRGPGRLAVIGGVALFLLVTGRGTFKRTAVDPDEDWRGRSYRAAIWLRENTRPDERAAMRVAEITGYFSDRQTVDLLGLAAGRALQEAIAAQRLGAYLDQASVRYLVQVGDLQGKGGPRIEVGEGEGDLTDGRYVAATLQFRSELSQTWSEPLPVRRQNEVYRERTARADDGVVIWKR